ncbi:TetR/AcrR family transcriptional regulator [Nocardia sp. NPDC057668]|uniref:TetR/AcrR family transcriptional regulator n=1 Tax=Nocardia sp. NPDC057668 TaxID=3346202 RepID=UPI00366F7495
MTVVEPLRERLVTAGVAMLEETGAAQLGLRAIAREAGVSHGAPRRYFPTHNALLAAIASRGYIELGTRLAAVQGESARARVADSGLEYVGFAARRPEMFALMFRHDLLEGAGGNLRATVTLPMFHRWRDLVGESAPGRSRAQVNELALSLWTHFHGIATVVATRSLEAVAPGADPSALVTQAVTRHLGTP